MNEAKKIALESATEITVALLRNQTLLPDKNDGEIVAEFYEVVFKKVLELANS